MAQGKQSAFMRWLWSKLDDDFTVCYWGMFAVGIWMWYALSR